VPDYTFDDMAPEEVERLVGIYEPLTDAVRGLVDATIRTTVEEAEIAAVRAEVEALTARLRVSQIDGSFGVRFSRGRGRAWGNTVVGVRNACAPPLHVERHPDGTGEVWSDFHLGAAYEGPPGLVHGGVSAMILDQMLGEAAGSGGKPGMTGTLTLSYRRATPLGDLRAEAWIDRSEGIKTWAKGHLLGPEGVCVEAEGVFILPRWARETTDRPAYFE
jgi:acyl-coenzyme A thioesterase PaaI-like protein